MALGRLCCWRESVRACGTLVAFKLPTFQSRQTTHYAAIQEQKHRASQESQGNDIEVANSRAWEMKKQRKMQKSLGRDPTERRPSGMPKGWQGITGPKTPSSAFAMPTTPGGIPSCQVISDPEGAKRGFPLIGDMSNTCYDPNQHHNTSIHNTPYFAIYRGIKMGAVWQVKALLEDPEMDPPLPVDCVMSALGETPLLMAAKFESIEVIDYLLDRGADINKLNANNWSALHNAAHRGSAKVISHLLSKGAILEASNDGGWRPLHCACHAGNEAGAKLLVEAGADLTAVTGGVWSVLHCTVAKGNANLTRYLCEKGANPDAQNAGGWTPIHCAAVGGSIEIIRMLATEFGADVNKVNYNNWTAIHCAIQSKDSVTVKLLLDLGTNPNHKNQGGWSALHIVAGTGDIEVAKTLLQHPTTDPSPTNDNGWTPLHGAAQHGMTEIVQLLAREYKADVNANNHGNWTPLHCAAHGGYGETVRALLDLGANSVCYTSARRTAYRLACDIGAFDVATAIHEHYKKSQGEGWVAPIRKERGKKHLEVQDQGAEESLDRALLRKFPLSKRDQGLLDKWKDADSAALDVTVRTMEFLTKRTVSAYPSIATGTGDPDDDAGANETWRACPGCRWRRPKDDRSHTRIHGVCKCPDSATVEYTCPGCEKYRPLGNKLHTYLLGGCKFAEKSGRKKGTLRTGRHPREPAVLLRDCRLRTCRLSYLTGLT